MRHLLSAACGVIALSAWVVPATAQTRDPAPVPSAPVTAPNPAFETAKVAADALGADEIATIQRALIWTGDLNTMASGEFGKRTFEAIRAFQRRLKAKETGILKDTGILKETGILLPGQRAALDKAAARAVAAYGFKPITEQGVTLGYPAKLALKRTARPNGAKLASPAESVTVDVLRFPAEAESFEALFERLKGERPGRKVTYSLLRPDFFVITGSVDGKSFYMRFLRAATDSRGFIVGWAPELSPDFDRVPIAMAVSLALADGADRAEKDEVVAAAAVPTGPPVPLAPGAAGAARSGPGFVVSDTGEVLTTATLVAGCMRVALVDGTVGSVVAGDLLNDVALVRLPRPGAAAVTWRSLPLGTGDAVTVLASADGRLAPSASEVTALSSPSGDMRRFTMRDGGAGGGVFDSGGALAGLLGGNDEPVAVKALFLSAFLRSQGVKMPDKTEIDPARAGIMLTCDPRRP
jgi:hypothetical protein